jgi:hypothetical protein
LARAHKPLGVMAILSLSLGLVALGSQAALAAPTSSEDNAALSGPNVIQYGAPTGMVETSRTIVDGVRNASGECIVSDGAWMSASSAPVIQEEVAFDPVTCQSLVATGHPLISPGPGTAPNGSLSGSGGMRSADSSTAGDPEGYVHAWVQDPTHILHVNDVWDEINWTPAGGCADAGGWTGKWYLQWFGEDGWYVKSNQSGFAPSCYSVVAASTVNFENDVFCLTTDNAYYEPVQIQGYANGEWYASWYLAVSGGCSGLLGFGVQYGSSNPF